METPLGAGAMYLLLLVCYITLHNSSETHSVVVTSMEVHRTQQEAASSQAIVPKSSTTYTSGSKILVQPHIPKEATGHNVAVTAVEAHKTEKEATGHIVDVTATEAHKTEKEATGSELTKSMSIPNVNITIIDNKFHIRCFCERGPENITYQLILGDQIVHNMTVHEREAATFQLNITSAMSSHLYCRARTLSGEVETSKPMRILGDTPESEDKSRDKKKSDKEEMDAAPQFLIPLQHILTSVSQPVQDVNILIISVCGPVLLILALIIVVIHFCKHRKPTLSISV